MRLPESFVGQPIRSLQTMLQVIAASNPEYQPVIPDGIYGPETMQAVAGFQRKHALPVTGITDQATWEAIVAVCTPSLVEVDAVAPIQVVWNPRETVSSGEEHPNLLLAQSMLNPSNITASVSHPSPVCWTHLQKTLFPPSRC